MRAYLAVSLLALAAAFSLAMPAWGRLALILAGLAHVGWCLPRQVLLAHPTAVTGLRRDARGWALYSRALGWHPVGLCRDTVVFPALVILRYRLPGQWRVRSVCVPADALAPQVHRRLRVRLTFSRGRFRVPARPASRQNG
nr:hypothetical protein [Pseudomonas typographi]